LADVDPDREGVLELLKVGHDRIFSKSAETALIASTSPLAAARVLVPNPRR